MAGQALTTEDDADDLKERFKQAQLATIARRDKTTDEVTDAYNEQAQRLQDALQAAIGPIQARGERIIELCQDAVDRKCKPAYTKFYQEMNLAKARRNVDRAVVDEEYAREMLDLQLKYGCDDDEE